MTTYACPEFAVTGLELQIIELQAQRESALRGGWHDQASGFDAEIARLWGELAALAEQYPDVA